MASPEPRPRPSRRTSLAALALILALAVTACGGSSDAGSDGSTDPSTSSSAAEETTTSAATDDGAATDDEAAGGDVDVCEAISAEDVGAILTEADIAEAKPNDALATPSCAYYVTWAGSPLSVVQITWNEDGFLDAMRTSNPTATEVDGLDAVAISDASIVIAGETGDYQIDGGIELSEGGDVATKEQLVAIAELAQGL